MISFGYVKVRESREREVKDDTTLTEMERLMKTHTHTSANYEPKQRRQILHCSGKYTTIEHTGSYRLSRANQANRRRRRVMYPFPRAHKHDH